MDNPSKMEPAQKNNSELINSLEVTRLDLMNTLREVTDQDFVYAYHLKEALNKKT